MSPDQSQSWREKNAAAPRPTSESVRARRMSREGRIASARRTTMAIPTTMISGRIGSSSRRGISMG
jgi:hypothetical protein